MSGNRALNKIFRMILLTVAGRKAIIQIDNKMFYVTDGNVESTTREHRICTPTVWAIRPWIAFFCAFIQRLFKTSGSHDRKTVG